MKLWKFLLAAAVVAVAVADDDDDDYEDARLCPFGYFYAGDDSSESAQPYSALNRDYYVEIESRSDVYSCYRLFYADTGAPDTWLSATHRCWSDQAQLASFEDAFEYDRVVNNLRSRIYIDRPDSGNSIGANDPIGYEFFTSGLKFEGGGWYWLGANESVEYEIQNESGDTNLIGDSPRDCLTMKIFFDEDKEPEFWAENCFAEKPFICEARVQTVVYQSWWSTNWVDVLLGFLLVVLFVALCIAICAYSSVSKSSSSSSHRRQQQQRSSAQVIDVPPAYSNAVSMESKPPQQSAGRMTYYKNRAGDMVTSAKVYIYKPKTGSSASNATA